VVVVVVMMTTTMIFLPFLVKVCDNELQRGLRSE
jgi:hypothetical protein